MTIKPLLIFIRGLPGSGKSHLSKPLAEAIQQQTGTSVTVLDPDATDYDSAEYKQHVEQLTAEGVDPALHAYRFLRAQAYQTIADGGVAIWNQPFTNLGIFNKMIARMHEQAAEHDTEVAILVVEVNVSPVVAHARVAGRKAAGGHGPSDATFERFMNDYESFEPHGYQTVIVSGQDDPSVSVEKILSEIQSIK